MCLEWTVDALDDPHCPIAVLSTWRNSRLLLALISSVIGAKASLHLPSSELAILSSVVLRAFLAVTTDAVPASPGAVAAARDPASLLRFFRVASRDVSCVDALPHSVVLDTPLPSHVRPGFKCGPCSVALFDVSLRLEQDGIGDVEVGACALGQAPGWSPAAVERERLTALAGTLVERGVGILACQRVVHPWLKSELADRGVLVLERLSLNYVGAVQAVTGAVVLSAWDKSVPVDCLGWVASANCVLLHGQRVVVLKGQSAVEPTAVTVPTPLGAVASLAKARSQPACTVILCAPTSHAAEELELAVMVRFSLCSMCPKPCVLCAVPSVSSMAWGLL